MNLFTSKRVEKYIEFHFTWNVYINIRRLLPKEVKPSETRGGDRRDGKAAPEQRAEKKSFHLKVTVERIKINPSSLF